jgi:hypothetical protein
VAGAQHAEAASTNSDGAAGDAVRGALARYLEDLAGQPLAVRTREAYAAHVSAYVDWLAGRPQAEGALREPRARDFAARDFKRHLKLERRWAPSSVNLALAAVDHFNHFLGLGPAVVARDQVAQAAPRALCEDDQRALLRAAEGAAPRDRAIVVMLLQLGVSRLVWLGREATSASPPQIVEQLDKLAYLRELGAERWALEAVPANRRRQLAALARRSSTAALAGRPDRLLYPALLCFCQEQLTRLVDEVLDRSDQALGEAHGRARRQLEQRKAETATAANEKVALFDLLVGLLLDDSIAEDELRQRAWQAMPPARWAAARDQARQILRPLDDNHFEQLAARYAHVRRFAPALLAALRFHGVPAARSLLDAIQLLRELNASGRRALPDAAPTRFVARPLAPAHRRSRRAAGSPSLGAVRAVRAAHGAARRRGVGRGLASLPARRSLPHRAGRLVRPARRRPPATRAARPRRRTPRTAQRRCRAAGRRARHGARHRPSRRRHRER